MLERLAIVQPGTGDAAADRIRGAALVFAGACAVVSPPVGALVAVGGWNVPGLVASRRSRREDRTLDDEVFLAVQLCVLAVHTGATVPATVAAIAPHLPGRLGAALRRATERHHDGELFVDTLSAVVTELGEPVVPLVEVLRAAYVDGDRIEPALVRLGDRLRDRRRRATEAEVRRLSVRLLLPLVCCSLPGFVLIAVVPLAVDALGGLVH